MRPIPVIIAVIQFYYIVSAKLFQSISNLKFLTMPRASLRGKAFSGLNLCYYDSRPEAVGAVETKFKMFDLLNNKLCKRFKLFAQIEWNLFFLQLLLHFALVYGTFMIITGKVGYSTLFWGKLKFVSNTFLT